LLTNRGPKLEEQYTRNIVFQIWGQMKYKWNPVDKVWPNGPKLEQQQIITNKVA
jgi:hypothetical protein